MLDCITKLKVLLPIVLVLAGCSSLPTRFVVDTLPLDDAQFPDYRRVTIESPDTIFALDSAARSFVNSTQNPKKTDRENLKALVNQIFSNAELGLRYQTDANSVASETFANQAANCLSLTIMAYAMAEYAGYNATFYEVDIPEYWTRREGVNLLNGHINLRVTTQSSISRIVMTDSYVDVDFDPQTIRSHFQRVPVSRAKVLAMFYNNKGADALLAGNNTQAYAYFRRAADTFEDFGSTWVNLGVLYRRTGQNMLAEKSYEKAISINEDNLTAWENLAYLYQLKGEEDKANEINHRVANKRDGNPFYHFILGEEALDYGEPEVALNHYFRAKKLDRNRHEILFGIGKAYYELGDMGQALEYLKLAAKNAPNMQDEHRYMSKLSTLQSAR